MNGRTFLIFSSAAAALATGGCVSLTQQRADIAIENVKIVDLATATVSPARTVFVKEGRIQRIGPATARPNSAHRIDGGGRYLMPGMVDAHIHLRHAKERALLAYLQAGITTVREMNGRAFILKWRDEINAGLRQGPTLVVASPSIGNFSSPREGWPTPTTAAEGAARVVQFANEGYDLIKVYSFVPPTALDGIVAEAARRRIKVAGHAPIDVPLERLFSSHWWSLEHFTGVAAEIATEPSARLAADDNRDVFHAVEIDQEKLRRLAALAASRRIWQVPTIVYWEIVPASPLFRKAWGDPALRKLGLKTRLRILKAMYDAGAPIAVGTDSDGGDDLPIESYWDELALMERSGMPPAAVLRAATLGGLRMLGLENRGRIAPGFIADLVLVSCNPLTVIDCVRSPALVVSRGAVVAAPRP